MSFRINPLKKSEQATALDIMVQCFGEKNKPYAEKDLAASLSDVPGAPLSFIAKIDGQSVGYAQTKDFAFTP